MQTKVDINVFITLYYENHEIVKTSTWKAGYVLRLKIWLKLKIWLHDSALILTRFCILLITLWYNCIFETVELYKTGKYIRSMSIHFNSKFLLCLIKSGFMGRLVS